MEFVTTMQHGAVAILDTLGFKGMWRRYAPEQIIAKLRVLQKQVESSITGQFMQLPDSPAGLPVVVPTCRYLADSVVVFALVHDPVGDVDLARDHALRGLVVAVRGFVQSASEIEPRFTYRGCIACGEFAVEDNFMLGPAVDEAAELAPIAEGPFVFLAPSALTTHHAIREVLHDSRFAPYFDVLAPMCDMPLKSGGNRRTRVLNVMAGVPTRLRKTFVSDYLDTFVGDERVDQKRRNAETFLTAMTTLPNLFRVLKPMIAALNRRKVPPTHSAG